jgi:hypothetical protein
MTRLYGRAPGGERVPGSAPQYYGPIVTLLGAMSCTGLEAVMMIEGATEAFRRAPHRWRNRPDSRSHQLRPG